MVNPLVVEIVERTATRNRIFDNIMLWLDLDVPITAMRMVILTRLGLYNGKGGLLVPE